MKSEPMTSPLHFTQAETFSARLSVPTSLSQPRRRRHDNHLDGSVRSDP